MKEKSNASALAYRPARNNSEDAWETKTQIVSQASSPVVYIACRA